VRENFATVLETVADVRADREAVAHGDRSLTWRQLDERAARLAAFLAGRGVGAEDRVAIALYNSPEYLESVFAVLKLRAIPVNVNYRYQAEEMLHLFSDAQVAALIFDGSLAPRVAAALRGTAPLSALVQVGSADADPAPVAAEDYEQVISSASPLPRAARGVDHWLMYTGGTTGKPKGVLVSHAWLYPVVTANGFRLFG
jgi:acyl-CoA synthetase (AMP-forming)/AMP-acid ligase II